MKIELTIAECAAIRAALNAVAWELDASKRNRDVPPIGEADWRFRTADQTDITLNSGQLRELANQFQKGE